MASVAVLGDVVLDRYLAGSTSRVSREAPIPVVLCEAERDNLGGAGNVVANLTGLGCGVWLAGLIGDDPEAGRVRSHLEARGAHFELFARPGRTQVKTRLLCGGQQVARFDCENPAPLDDSLVPRAVRFLEDALDEGVRAVILSDYGLGFCTPALCRSVIASARARGVPVFVDPRGRDWSRYKGASAVTPNLAELALVRGVPVPNRDRDVEAAASEVLRRFGLGAVLVTRSSKGMTLVEEEGTVHIAARSVEVFDVSGAGDTVIAVLAAFVASGCSLEVAARLSNEAAQFVVTRAETYPISADELLRELDAAPRPGAARVLSRSSAAAQCRGWKEAGCRVVFTNGCFDVLHAGHLDSLERARALGDRLIVGLNSDASVRRLKGPSRPVNASADRALLLAALRVVDCVVVFEEDTPRELLAELRPHVLVKGGDYRAEELPGREFVQEVVILPLVEGLSTTEILRRGRG